MNWSYSHDALHRKCPRHWYYKVVIASAKSKDPVRREAYLLSKLDSIWSWRGKIVDSVISDQVVRSLSDKRLPTLKSALAYADHLYTTQLNYAQHRGIKDKALVVGKLGATFAALHDFEYGPPPTPADLNQAKADIHVSLRHLFGNAELLQSLLQAQKLITQRTLHLKRISLDGQSLHITAVPDLIVFRRNDAPLIIDWKVKFFSRNDAYKQLMLYGFALHTGQKHADFPVTHHPLLGTSSPDHVDLMEYQLLDDVQRRYAFTSADADTVEDTIHRSAVQMAGTLDYQEPDPALPIQEIPPTLHPEHCNTCNFKRLCLEDPNEHG